MRVAVEDALGLLFRLEERRVDADATSVERLLRSDVRIGPARVASVLNRLRRRSLAAATDGAWRLTEAGRAEASGLVRAHRLWETYLAGRSSIPSSHLHEAAERLEHVTDRHMAEALGKAVDDADLDPHGRPIPPA
jgi:Mn-dependent DtxR family transcriptional regulator